MSPQSNKKTSVRKGWLAATVVVVLAIVTIGLVSRVFGGADGAETPPDRRIAPVDGPLEPAYLPPPDSGPETWSMPHLWRRKPPFPYLPGDDRTRSRSIGDVTHGHLVNSVEIPQPHPALMFLADQYERRLFSTTDRMKRLIEEAAGHVQQEHPDAIVQLGNFGNPGGGDIPYSVSHNSGRDADLGFFLKTPDGEPVIPPDLVELGPDGRHEGKERTYVFDTERNWRLVEGLVEHAGDQLQYIFVSNPLRRKLLEFARENEAPSDIVWRAKQLLHQPGGALPHNDHFHFRIYCSELDVRSGCRDRGVQRPWYDAHTDARRDAIRRAREALDADGVEGRTAAARRLALLEAREAADTLRARLDDPSPRVRAASARALASVEAGLDGLVDRLDGEDDPQAYLEVVDALSRLGGRKAVEALAGELESARELSLPGQFEVDARTFIAEAAIRLEDGRPVPELIAMLSEENPEVRVAAAKALRYLTNHQFGGAWASADAADWQPALEKWRNWHDEHGTEARDEWLKRGFREAGFEVTRLDARHVWRLCRAIKKDDHLSYNAQRILMRISGRSPKSLSWSKEDANFYWRRWFERRWQRMGAPPVPEELSTLE